MYHATLHIGSADTVFADVRSEWQELYSAVDCSPFLSWEWMSVWFENFGDGTRPFILKVFRDNRLVGILPMLQEKKNFLGLRYDQIAFVGNGPGGADYLDLIVRPENRKDSLTAIVDFLSAERRCDRISFENLDATYGTAGSIKGLALADGNRFRRYTESPSAICPQIELSGGWVRVLSESKRSANFKRRLKKIEKMPGFEFRSITSSDETDAAFERFLTLHESRWKESGGSALSGHPRLISFQRRLVPELSKAGLLRFDELWIEGECRSSIYGLDDGKTFYYYNSGFDLSSAHLSVGLVLLGLSIKNAVERGNRLYDFLRGDEAYKFDWANRQTHLVNLTLSGSSLPAVVSGELDRASSKVSKILKSAMPTRLGETLGSWRQAWKRNYHLSER